MLTVCMYVMRKLEAGVTEETNAAQRLGCGDLARPLPTAWRWGHPARACPAHAELSRFPTALSPALTHTVVIRVPVGLHGLVGPEEGKGRG